MPKASSLPVYGLIFLTYCLLHCTFTFTSPQQQQQLFVKSPSSILDEIPFLNPTLSSSDSASTTNGTQGYYLSPHALGKNNQVHDTLNNMLQDFQISTTTYNHSIYTYTMSNFSIQLNYNDGRQTVSIGQHQDVDISGGRVYFGYRFNWTKKQTQGHDVPHPGYGHGYVYSDSLQYKKTLIINSDGFLEWALTNGTDAFTNLTIHDNRMRIQRIQPYTQDDVEVLQQILDKAFQNISPSNIETQLLKSFNTHFPSKLNESLNHEVLGHQINYTYHDHLKGELNMTVIHKLYGFDINPTDGYKIIYKTLIKGHENQDTCNITVPQTHDSFDVYGGIQNIHLNCLYQDVVNYAQKQGWLDTQLNSQWEVNAFQFYAGDLFDLINNLYTSANPRSILQGECKASSNNLVLKSSPEFESNTYSLSILYKCKIHTTSKTAERLEVLNFDAETKLYIRPSAEKLTLEFQVVDADVMSLAFEPISGFYVTNINLAVFKADQVLKKMIKQRVFGSGFPSLPRQSPKTRVDTNYTMYYDASAVADDGEVSSLIE